MKQEWSNNWKSSKQPRKQRKYRYNAPNHVRHKFLSTHLSPALRKNFKRRAISIHKGDEIKVMEGSFKGKIGTVERVNLKKCKVYVDNIKVKKVDGTEVMRAIEPSNLMITKLNLDDKLRNKSINKTTKKVPEEKIMKKVPEKKIIKKVTEDKK